MMNQSQKELISYELKIDGFSVIESEAHGLSQLSSLACNFDNRFADKPATPYRPTIFKENDLSKPSNKDISRLNDFCLTLIDEIKAEQKHLDAIFATIDTPDSKHIAQDPHFDRIPTLKFMLYLNDLSYTSGAFCLSAGSHLWTKENFGPYHRRKSHGAPGFLEKSRNIPAHILRRLKPIEGKAGTIIVFDTDCIHHQGIVQTGQANIIRAHYRVKAKGSTIGNFIKKLKG
jgi:ectoine hydroxylase-related dioxygenase (phytanoyl-CoA dioxygenase family)